MLVSHLSNGAGNVHQLFLLNLLQDIVNAYEYTRTPNPSTAILREGEVREERWIEEEREQIDKSEGETERNGEEREEE